MPIAVHTSNSTGQVRVRMKFLVRSRGQGQDQGRSPDATPCGDPAGLGSERGLRR